MCVWESQAPRPCKAHCFVPITAWPGTLATQTMNRFYLCQPRLGPRGWFSGSRGSSRFCSRPALSLQSPFSLGEPFPTKPLLSRPQAIRNPHQWAKTFTERVQGKGSTMVAQRRGPLAAVGQGAGARGSRWEGRGREAPVGVEGMEAITAGLVFGSLRSAREMKTDIRCRGQKLTPIFH